MGGPAGVSIEATQPTLPDEADDASRLPALRPLGQVELTYIVAESADVLYHLLVVWAATGVKPKAVYDVLQARRAQSGLTEKKSRKR